MFRPADPDVDDAAAMVRSIAEQAVSLIPGTRVCTDERAMADSPQLEVRRVHGDSRKWLMPEISSITNLQKTRGPKTLRTVVPLESMAAERVRLIDLYAKNPETYGKDIVAARLDTLLVQENMAWADTRGKCTQHGLLRGTIFQLAPDAWMTRGPGRRENTTWICQQDMDMLQTAWELISMTGRANAVEYAHKTGLLAAESPPENMEHIYNIWSAETPSRFPWTQEPVFRKETQEEKVRRRVPYREEIMSQSAKIPQKETGVFDENSPVGRNILTDEKTPAPEDVRARFARVYPV